MAGSAQTHKSISFIWIVWSTLYVYLCLLLRTKAKRKKGRKEVRTFKFLGFSQRYTFRVLQTIQMKLILLCVWAERAILGSAKTALKFTVSYLWLYGIPALPSEYRNTPQEISQAADGRSKGLILQFLTVYLEAVPLILLWCQNYLMRITVNETHKKEMC